MTPDALAHYLHQTIPLARAMAVEVGEVSDGMVALRAPLPPNLNMHGTMFGGSIATLGLLACWSVLHLRLVDQDIAAQLVVHRSETEFLRPVAGIAEARAHLAPALWPDFATTLRRRGRARMALTSEMRSGDQLVARFSGQFVALAEI
ncbi:MAG: YiiD C-terminal domain-containing protein [Devosia sp.]|uniref:YiiD C-terminal domain-containing protein n=1 Tax=Devosia sp. TaxID=1871048 RepID=UPI0024C57CDA|nr:YiiD C-terminal domain-containing protein [Devosia sp.]UYO00083.1 MAG: YiiD C-terminal domain-containing protein [Devosia sp.]